MTATIQATCDWRKDFWREHETDAEHADRVKAAEKLSLSYFHDLTAHQRGEFLQIVAAAENAHGHGSQAHDAAIDLAKRSWERDTAEAVALMDETAIEIMRDGEVSEAMSERWDALGAARSVMEAAE